MTSDEYQKLAARTLIDKPEQALEDNEHMLVWNVFGLVGECAELVKHFDVPHSRQALLHAGIIAETCKKGIFHQRGLDTMRVLDELTALLMRLRLTCCNVLTIGAAKEVGDVLWYAAAICTKLGCSMSRVLPDPDSLASYMEQNIEKLAARLPNGWNADDAAARRDEVQP